jgi:ubiquinone/menaquinone biosynthesis C-methylase UbiE
MYRVLKENGKAVIIDMRRDASEAAIRDTVKSLGLGRKDSLKMKWLFKGIRRQAYTKNQFENFISKTKFRRYDIRGSNDLIAFEIWLKK